LKYGSIAMTCIAAVLLLIFVTDRNALHDSRYHQSLAKALLACFVIVPFETVLFEELAFRGLLPALLQRINLRPRLIMLTSSVLFGLWHLASAPSTANFSAARPSHLLIMAGVFVATTTAGAVFYWLRQKSDSLVASTLAHWAINSFAIILAALSWSGH
jgi:membrane protease YdiL (CAAX protease family)